MSITRSSVAIALSCAFAFAGLPASGSTMVVKYHPAGMRVTATLRRGNCWTQSISVSRADAYRCMVGNNIYDPCFTTGSRRVACPLDLVRNEGIIIALRAPLARNPSGNDTAWAMLLADGVTCAVITGTEIAGFPFGCGGRSICSAPKRGPSGYTALCAVRGAHGKSRSIAVYEDLDVVIRSTRRPSPHRSRPTIPTVAAPTDHRTTDNRTGSNQWVVRSGTACRSLAPRKPCLPDGRTR